MIIAITPETHHQIKNPQLAAYAGIYLRIYEDFLKQLRATGIEIDDAGESEPPSETYERLQQKGVIFRNGGRSIVSGAISEACVACKKGVGSATFFISLKCNRSCYYCFNPNQVDYEHHRSHERDLIRELDEMAATGQQLSCVALTGGEPLLHKAQAIHFFQHAGECFPNVHTRLYTCGDYVDEAVLAELRDAGLREIRFSIRMHDTEHLRKRILERVALAKKYIQDVMIELPIIPGTLDIMKDILRELDRIGIYSINLLELCYPLLNADEFKARGFKVKKRPFQTLYDYWYAGGVPIAGSEAECLELLEFARDEGMKMGVHYCSLENKLTGQNYQQNASHPVPRTAILSQQDYLLKSAKVFGDDIAPVMSVFEHEHIREYAFDPDHNCLEFSVNAIRALKKLDVEIGISTSVFEQRPDGMVIRELKVDLTTPRMFKRADV